MHEFQRIYHPFVPPTFPVVLKAANTDNLQHYEEWCYKCLGRKFSEGTTNRYWYQARGYFFFANSALASAFILGANRGGETIRLPNQSNKVPPGDRLHVHGLQDEIQRRFQEFNDSRLSR